MLVVFAVSYTFLLVVFAVSYTFLLVVFAVSYTRRRTGRVVVGLVGIVSTFIAAGVQQAGLAVHPNHNALYHLIQDWPRS